MAFEFNKVYEVSAEWKQYFDGFGNDYLGYYYVTPEDPNISYDIQKCVVINKLKLQHPFFEAIPFKFSDCKLCSLSSTAKLKLFKVVNKDYVSAYEVEEAIVVETDEDAAANLNIEDLPASSAKKVEYLGDYYGELKAGSVILSKTK